MERSWDETQTKAMRGRLVEAARQGIWLSAAEARMFLGLLTLWQRVSTTGWQRPNEGRLETIAEARARGIVEISVSCDSRTCHRADRKLKIVDLHMPPGRRPLPDTACFLDIPNLCRFRCVRCGSRRIRMMPVWPAFVGALDVYDKRAAIPRIEPGRRWSDDT